LEFRFETLLAAAATHSGHKAARLTEAQAMRDDAPEARLQAVVGVEAENSRRRDSLPRRQSRGEAYETRDNGFLHTFRIPIVFVFQIYYSEVFG
jgi:hypothetical protein